MPPIRVGAVGWHEADLALTAGAAVFELSDDASALSATSGAMSAGFADYSAILVAVSANPGEMSAGTSEYSETAARGLGRGRRTPGGRCRGLGVERRDLGKAFR